MTSNPTAGPIDPFPVASEYRSHTCGLLDYDAFDVRPGFVNDSYILAVFKKDHDSRIIPSLNPRVYITRPEYWEIELIGCLSGIVPPKNPAAFPLALGLDGCMGTKGIKLIGATRSDQWSLPKR
jgi:hypothetical protein